MLNEQRSIILLSSCSYLGAPDNGHKGCPPVCVSRLLYFTTFFQTDFFRSLLSGQINTDQPPNKPLLSSPASSLEGSSGLESCIDKQYLTGCVVGLGKSGFLEEQTKTIFSFSKGKGGSWRCC